MHLYQLVFFLIVIHIFKIISLQINQCLDWIPYPKSNFKYIFNACYEY